MSASFSVSAKYASEDGSLLITFWGLFVAPVWPQVDLGLPGPLDDADPDAGERQIRVWQDGAPCFARRVVLMGDRVDSLIDG